MKKIVFEWITQIIDYDTAENALRDIKKFRNKGYHIKAEGWTKNPTFDGQETVYTVEVCKKANNRINTGW